MVEKKSGTRTITLRSDSGAFNAIFGRFRSEKKHTNSDITLLRSLFSNEKARLLHVLKTKQPNSIYELAKILGRDFKSVRTDISALENFGFIEMIPVHKGRRQKLKPLLVIDELKITVEI